MWFAPESPSSPEIRRLAARFDALVDLGREAGITLVPYKDARLPHVAAMTPEDRAALVTLVDQYYEVMVAEREDNRFMQNEMVIWRMLGRTRLVPPSDLFSVMEDGDVIELYDTRSRQIFRSFAFFKLATYTLEELYARPWFELYHRPDAVHKYHLQLIDKAVAGEITGTHMIQAGQHLITETRPHSGGRFFRTCLNEPRFFSPLTDGAGQLSGFIYAFRPIETKDVPAIATT